MCRPGATSRHRIKTWNTAPRSPHQGRHSGLSHIAVRAQSRALERLAGFVPRGAPKKPAFSASEEEPICLNLRTHYLKNE